jgi:hypothetical protein
MFVATVWMLFILIFRLWSFFRCSFLLLLWMFLVFFNLIIFVSLAFGWRFLLFYLFFFGNLFIFFSFFLIWCHLFNFLSHLRLFLFKPSILIYRMFCELYNQLINFSDFFDFQWFQIQSLPIEHINLDEFENAAPLLFKPLELQNLLQFWFRVRKKDCQSWQNDTGFERVGILRDLKLE